MKSEEKIYPMPVVVGAIIAVLLVIILIISLGRSGNETPPENELPTFDTSTETEQTEDIAREPEELPAEILPEDERDSDNQEITVLEEAEEEPSDTSADPNETEPEDLEIQ